MSLLMDALKKAEQEKKEAARRLKEAREKAGGQIELQAEESRDPSAATGDAAKATDKKEQQPEPAPIVEKKSTPELSLSPLDETITGPVPTAEPPAELKESSLSLEQDNTLDHPEFSDTDQEGSAGDEEVVLSGPDETFALNDPSREDTKTKPLEDTANATLQEKHADTLSDSHISRSIVSAAELVKDMGGGRENPTPVAAQTVFRAARNSGRQQMVEWVMFLGLLTAVLVAAGTFYYFRITPLVPDTTSPLVARGIEAELAPPMIMSVPDAAPVAVPAAGGATEESPAGTGATDDATVTAIEPVTAMPTVAAEEETEISAQTVEETAAAPMDDQVAETPAAIAAREAVLPEKIQVEPAAIAISRGKSVARHDELINQAYTEYLAGNFAGAETAYLNVLKEKPENRDALLGIAAVAWHKGNLQLAWENYLKVLKLYPRDIAARTALVQLQGDADPVRSESIIKLMLQENPETAFLHFTLGNVYATQSRWEEAQQAFFEAYRRQSDNSDYAYNLAVSLDHIGQAKTAGEYYRIALDLADETEASFNTAAVMTRLAALSSIVNSD